MKKFDVGFTATHIIHSGDIHIRSVKRHTEYRIVFQRFFDQCIEIVKNNPNTLIYIGGDVLHSKLELSPESVDLTRWFLQSLADIAPTVLITGNHDCNLNNTHRLDALTPIVDALNHSNLFYFKDTDLYEIGGVTFSVMSLWQHPTEYLNAQDFDADYKIAVHHGAVDHARTDMGFLLHNEHLTTSKFDGYDITLLADIHKMQKLSEYECNELEIDEDDLQKYLDEGWEITG